MDIDTRGDEKRQNKREKYCAMYNQHLPHGSTIEAEHFPAISACGNVLHLYTHSLTEDESELDENLFDFFIHVSMYEYISMS